MKKSLLLGLQEIMVKMAYIPMAPIPHSKRILNLATSNSYEYTIEHCNYKKSTKRSTSLKLKKLSFKAAEAGVSRYFCKCDWEGHCHRIQLKNRCGNWLNENIFQRNFWRLNINLMQKKWGAGYKTVCYRHNLIEIKLYWRVQCQSGITMTCTEAQVLKFFNWKSA